MSHCGLLANIFGGGLHCVEIRQLICKMSWLAGFFMVWDFAGVFLNRLQHNFNLGSSYHKVSFCFHNCCNVILVVFRLLACSLLKSSFLEVFIKSFCTYSTGVYFDDFFHWMCFLLLIVLYPQDTLAYQFVFFNFVNLMTILLGAVL